jgi:septal ring factor EnvC (AmiA/AmiB activator)
MLEIQISVGELLDKLSILKIKKEKILDDNKLKYVEEEFDILNEKSSSFLNDDNIKKIYKDLYSTNKDLWAIEDELRILEKLNEFNAQFVDLARKVYKVNDHRFSLKSKINDITNSLIKEQKSYK